MRRPLRVLSRLRGDAEQVAQFLYGDDLPAAENQYREFAAFGCAVGGLATDTEHDRGLGTVHVGRLSTSKGSMRPPYGSARARVSVMASPIMHKCLSETLLLGCVGMEMRTLVTVTGAEARYIGMQKEGLLVPYPIQVESEDRSLPFDVVLTVEPDEHANFVCSDLRVSRRPDGPAVTPTSLQRVPIKAIVEEAVRRVTIKGWDAKAGKFHITSDDVENTRKDVAPVLRRPRRRDAIVKPSEYRLAASLYRKAARARTERGTGPAPVNALMDKWRIKRPTAYKLRDRLRTEGFLKEHE